MSPAPLNESGKPEYLRVIWQSLVGKSHFTQSAIVIEVSPVKIPRPCKMRFARVGAKTKGRLDGRFRHGKARGRAIVTKEIKGVINIGNLAICSEK
jgi:hypothetical protein